MKFWSSVPLVWARIVIAVLLITLAATVLLMTRSIEHNAGLVDIDSVPGLIEANGIRSDCSEEFTVLVQRVDEHPHGPVDMQDVLARFDERLAIKIAAYRRTIRIDPRRDNRLLDAVLAARTEYLQRRDEVRSLLAANRVDEAQAALAKGAAPAYHTLILRCDELVAYNGGTSSVYTARVASIAVALRWVALGTLRRAELRAARCRLAAS